MNCHTAPRVLLRGRRAHQVPGLSPELRQLLNAKELLVCQLYRAVTGGPSERLGIS